MQYVVVIPDDAAPRTRCCVLAIVAPGTSQRVGCFALWAALEHRPNRIKLGAEWQSESFGAMGARGVGMFFWI